MSNAIFAYFIGISKYSNPHHNLLAPENDLARIQELIETAGKRSNRTVVSKVLKNEEATRANVIDGFNIFQAATPEDICVFFYTGHGSQIIAPYFLNQSNALTESLVCHDSRLPDHHDLADKEIAFLLNQQFAAKNNHLTVIMDCCNAGGNTRGSIAKSKMLKGSSTQRTLDSFLGRESYVRQDTTNGEKWNIAPPPHLHLAACAAEELAKELKFDGKTQSVFTHFLYESLTQQNGKISYANLLREVRLRTKQFVSKQHPELKSIGMNPTEKQGAFLNGVWQAPTTSYFVFKEDNFGWCVNAGAVDGLAENDKVILDSNNKSFALEEILTQKAELDLNISLDPTQLYACKIKKAINHDFSFAIVGAFPTSFTSAIENYIPTRKIKNWSIVSEKEKAAFFITQSDGALVVLKKDDFVEGDILAEDILIRQKINIEDWERTARSLIIRIDQWTNFNSILRRRNPFSAIDFEAIAVTAKVLQAQPSGQLAAAAEVDIATPIELPFFTINNQTIASELSLDIKNTADIPLWASAQILGPGWNATLNKSTRFSVTNRFMQSERIDPEQSKGLIDAFEGQEYTTLPFSLEADYLQQFGNSAEFFIQLWISTEPVDTDLMNTKGLPINTDFFYPAATRRSSLDPYEPDWQTFTIPLLVKKMN